MKAAKSKGSEDSKHKDEIVRRKGRYLWTLAWTWLILLFVWNASVAQSLLALNHESEQQGEASEEEFDEKHDSEQCKEKEAKRLSPSTRLKRKQISRRCLASSKSADYVCPLWLVNRCDSRQPRAPPVSKAAG